MDDNPSTLPVQGNPSTDTSFHGNDTAASTDETGGASNTLEVAGYRAIHDPWKFPGFTCKHTREECDHVSLTKLHYTGFDVATLDDAHTRFHISPLRTAQDIWQILGYHTNIYGRGNTDPRYKEQHVTALAFQYPNVKTPGEAFPHTRIIKVRPRTPTTRYNAQAHAFEELKYEQPRYVKNVTSHSEPYFLFTNDTWVKLQDTSRPLIITEGELKACALNLSGHTAIAFGGATMWRAKSAGKDRLHMSLTPGEPGAIPIQGREVILLPDVDYHSKEGVRREFRALGKALMVAGASRPRIAFLDRPRHDEWKGVDDFLTFHLKPRWGGDPNLVAQAFDLIQRTITTNCDTITETSFLNATDPARCAERIYEKLSSPNSYTVVLSSEVTSNSGKTDVGWGTYTNGFYELEQISFTTGVSGKMRTPGQTLRKIIADDYYSEGLTAQALEGATPKGGPKGMPSDHPNNVLAHMDTMLPRADNNTLLDSFPGVSDGDYCIRITGALVNLTNCLKLNVSWDNRDKWLLPSDHRWFSIGGVRVSLSNCETKPTCPSFLKLISHVLNGDQQKINCLQLWFGKIVTSPMFVGRKQFLCLYGAADTGKSTITDILRRLLGEEEIIAFNAGIAGRFDLAPAVGKRLIMFPETPDGDNYAFAPYWADMIKGITGGDLCTIERKGRDPYSTQLKLEILTVGNNPPIMRMDRAAFMRRAVFLSTTHPIVVPDENEKDRMLSTELPGIFLWALQGAAALSRGERIDTPDACRPDLDAVTTEVDIATTFVKTQLQQMESTHRNEGMTASEIQEAFHEWALMNRYRETEASRRRLTRIVTTVYGVESVSTTRNGVNVRVFPGIKPKSSF